MLAGPMSLSLPQASRPDFFERHIRRLAWYTLLASVVLLIPITRKSDSPDIALATALGAAVLVTAVLTVVRDVGRYVRQEQVRRQTAVTAAQQLGACLAAATIHDRIANQLSVTVGYVELVGEAEQLSPLAREQAELAIQAALAATRAVSAFKESLGCEALAVQPPSPRGGLGASVREKRVTFRPGKSWVFDPHSRTIRTEEGVIVATISPTLDRSSAMMTARLMTDAPAIWEVLGEVQHLGVSLLANRKWSRPVEVELCTVLERINALAGHVQP
jgi:hypothetical protein